MMQLSQHKLMWKLSIEDTSYNPPPPSKKKKTPNTHTSKKWDKGAARERQDLRQIHKILEEVQITLCH